MALDFPNNPTVNQQFAAPNGVTYVWDGVKWSVLSGSGGGGGGVPSQITGPLSIGAPLSPAPSTATLVADQVVTRIGAPGVIDFGFNLYTDASGTARYVANGPGADLGIHSMTVGGATVPRFAINVAANNTAGPGAAAPGTQILGGLNIVAATDSGGNIAPFAVIGSGIDVPPVSPVKDSLIANQLIARGVIAPDNASVLGLNLYFDETGAQRYLGNGAAGFIDAHDVGTGVARVSVSVYDINTAGAGATQPTASRGALQIVRGPPGQDAQPFVVVGTAGEIPLTVFPRRASLIAHDVIVRADPLDPTDRVSRIGLNGFQDNAPPATASWHYLADGPAGTVTIHDANVGATPLSAASMRFGIADAGTANSNLVNAPRFVVFGPSGTNINQTNIMLTLNTSGTPTLTQVEIGAPGSGGAGRRALVVPD